MRNRTFGMIAAAIFMAMTAHTALAANNPQAGVEVACRGEEPFWGLRADRTRAVMTTLDGERVVAGRLEVLEWLPPGWLVWRNAAGEAPLVAVLRTEACFSTMADDPARSHRVLVIDGDERVMTGCCAVTAAP